MKTHTLRWSAIDRVARPQTFTEQVRAKIGLFRGQQLPDSDAKETKPTRPYSCKAPVCAIKPSGDKAGLIRHGREVHGVQAEGGPVSEFFCLIAGCKRGRNSFSRRYNPDQHYRRTHGQSVDEGESENPLGWEQTERAR